MTSVWDEISPPPDPLDALIVNGRYKIEADGKGTLHTRITTWAKTLEDTFRIQQWAKRQVALGVVAARELPLKIAAVRDPESRDGKNELDALCEEAIQAAGGHAKREIGTLLHHFTELLDRGETPTVPAPYDLDLIAYTQALTLAGIETSAELMEKVVVLDKDTLGTPLAGRFDRLVRLPGRDGYVVADLKTGSVDFSWPSIAIQLACYAHADAFYDPVAKEKSPVPVKINQDVGLVFHLPAGQATCTIYTVDIASGWEASKLCATVRKWRGRRTIAAPLEIVAEPTPEENEVALQEQYRDWLKRRIENLRDNAPGALAALAEGWPASIPTFKQSELHSPADLRVIDALISNVEKRVGMMPPPFNAPACDPDVRTRIAELYGTLSPEQQAEVEAQSLAAQIPNVMGASFTAVHAEQLKKIIAGVQVEVAA